MCSLTGTSVGICIGCIDGFLCCQYELVAELFREEDDAASDAKAKRGAAVVRASKETQKSTQQLRQHKKTVSSQVSLLFLIIAYRMSLLLLLLLLVGWLWIRTLDHKLTPVFSVLTQWMVEVLLFFCM